VSMCNVEKYAKKAACSLLFHCLAYSSTLKKDTVSSMNFYQATRRHISKHSSLHKKANFVPVLSYVVHHVKVGGSGGLAPPRIINLSTR
jgi:hypothetical protein